MSVVFRVTKNRTVTQTATLDLKAILTQEDVDMGITTEHLLKKFAEEDFDMVVEESQWSTMSELSRDTDSIEEV